MTAAIWSTPPGKCALDFPACTLVSFLGVYLSHMLKVSQIQFMFNHHLLQITGKPSWLTIQGGRYASSSRSASSSQGEPSSERAHGEEAAADGGVPSTAEPAAGDTRDEEDDQRTIRGRRDTIVADPEGKMIGNGVAARGQEDAGEKTVNGHGVQHSDAPVLVHGTS